MSRTSWWDILEAYSVCTCAPHCPLLEAFHELETSLVSDALLMISRCKFGRQVLFGLLSAVCFHCPGALRCSEKKKPQKPMPLRSEKGHPPLNVVPGLRRTARPTNKVIHHRFLREDTMDVWRLRLRFKMRWMDSYALLPIRTLTSVKTCTLQQGWSLSILDMM